MSDAELLLGLFQGSNLSHGHTRLTEGVNARGKQESQSWTARGPATLEHWEAHLCGHMGLGIALLDDANRVHFGAIDIDAYQGMDHVLLNSKVQQHALPLVVCRSKSGGAHLMVFFTQPVPAALCRSILDRLAGFLGYASSEIYPKQSSLSPSEIQQNFASWLNVPYFGRPHTLRYGYGPEGTALTEVSAFVAYCKAKALTPDMAANYQPPVTGVMFEDGPPCLQTLFASRPRENRNILLANAAVYAKKKHGADWAVQLQELNRVFDPPLPPSEVNAIIKSYEKKDYKYGCKIQPLCGHCAANTCKQRQYGISRPDGLPEGRSLSKIETVPPLWFLDISVPISPSHPDGKARISLSTEELQNPRKFQLKTMEAVNKMPPLLGTEDWTDLVSGLMAHMTTIPVSEEETPAGQLLSHLDDFLRDRSDEDDPDCVARGLAFIKDGTACFKLRDFVVYLGNQRFTALKQHEVIAILHLKRKARQKNTRVAGRAMSLVLIPYTPDGADEPLNPTIIPPPV